MLELVLAFIIIMAADARRRYRAARAPRIDETKIRRHGRQTGTLVHNMRPGLPRGLSLISAALSILMVVQHDGFVRDGVARIDRALENYARADLPTPGNAGRIARVTDGPRGIYMDNGTKWFQVTGNVVDLAELGAVGDGIVDDTAAIQLAITATNWPAAGAKLRCQPGATYKVTSDLTLNAGGLTSTPPLLVEGNGCIFTTTVAGIKIFDCTNSVVSATHIKFQDVRWNCNAASTCIKLTNCENTQFVNCIFGGSFSLGLEIAGTSTYTNLSDCFFANMARGIHVTGAASFMSVQDCAFAEQISGDSLNWIEVDNTASINVGLRVVSCTFYCSGATLSAIRIHKSEQALISACVFEQGDSGAYIELATTSVSKTAVTGCTFIRSTGHDILIAGASHATISGNEFGPRRSGTAANTFANVRVTGSSQYLVIVGNSSFDTVSGITYVVEMDSGCVNNVVVGNSGAAGYLVPNIQNVVDANVGPNGSLFNRLTGGFEANYAFRMANMTTANKNAISSPQAGMLVYDTTLGKAQVYEAGAWVSLV